MKGFSMKDGDVMISDTIEMADGSELVRQKIERVLGTNKGEWHYDKNEGIDFSVVLCKNPDKDEIRATIEQAITNIDETFVVTDFSMKLTGRSATITYSATNSDGEVIGGEYTYAG